MSDDEEEEKVLKVVLLGQSGVGKTCIISQFINHSFDKNVVTSTGGSYACKQMIFKEFDNQKIMFEIWDTAGQERYRSLTQIFYKDASIAILVYDITSAKSFEELKNYWYNQIKECAPKDIIIGVCGNKEDLVDKEQVSFGEAKSFADDIGAMFGVVSALTSAGIENMFYEVGLKYLNPKYKGDLNENKEKSKNDNGEKREGKGKTYKLDNNNTNDNKKKKKKCCK